MTGSRRIRQVSNAVYLLFEWTKRDFRVKYTQTALGGLWAIAQPLTLSAGLAFIFGRVAGVETGVPYPAFVFPSMLAWLIFAQGVTNAIASLWASMHIASRARFPRIVAPLAGSALGLVDLSFGIVILPLFLIGQGRHVQLRPVQLLVSLFGIAAFTTGVGLITAALSVFIRDVRNLLSPLLQLGLLLTPVAYPSDRLPPALLLNPMATFVEGVRGSILVTASPTIQSWTRALLVAAAAVVIGGWYFARVEARFPDVA